MVDPNGGVRLGQDNFFTGPEHEQYNSHQKRQMHLKGQWRMEDMDPEGSIQRDILLRQQDLMARQEQSNN